MNKIFEYYCCEIAVNKLDMELDECGKHGWELITMGVIQIPKQSLQGMIYDTKFKLIFKKEKDNVRN